MKQLIPIALLVCAATLGVVGVFTSPDTEMVTPEDAAGAAESERQVTPAPPRALAPMDAYPRAELTTDAEEWLKFSPMRVKMRSMWLDCAVIAMQANNELVDFDQLESAAADIALKAGQFADMWQDVRDHNRRIAKYARDEDWFNANYETQRMWMACTRCHIDNWSPATRGMIPASIEAWYERGYATSDAPYGSMRLTTPRPFIRDMFTMMGYLNMAIGDISEHHGEGVMEATRTIDGVIKFQLDRWNAIARYAESIREPASRLSVRGVRGSYAKLAGMCTGCHARFVNDGRIPLNPLPMPTSEQTRRPG